MIGSIIMILACMGSAGCGLSFCCKNIVSPIAKGQTPIARNSGEPKPIRLNTTASGSNGMRPNRANSEVGSGAERSLIQPKNGA